MIVLIDNYDSFTYNLVQRLGEIDPSVELFVARNDRVTVDEIEAKRPTHVIISPGPCTPREAGVSNAVIERFGPIPTLGVCLGHQCIGHTFGGNVVRADRIMHGKTSMIYHDGKGVYRGLPNPFEATRYHSLVIQPGTLRDDFEVVARTDQDEIMGVRHKSWPLEGVQYHPESFLTPEGVNLLKNFIGREPMLTVDEALRAVLDRAAPLPARRRPLVEALGCVLAEGVTADLDSPPFDKALVDGYALRAADLSDRDRRLRVGEEITAGRTPTRPLAPGEAAVIMTGAPLPPGADAVVMVERTRRDGDHVLVDAPDVSPGQNRLVRGREMSAGEVVLASGARLNAPRLGLLAAVGRTAVRVVPRPNVVVVSTGDELVEPGLNPGPGQIRNSNATMLHALARSFGFDAEVLPTAPDEPGALRAILAKGLDADALLVSGGVSAGSRDLVPAALESLGVANVFHKVRLKPGKPLWFGVGPARTDDRPGALVFGLPGNPVSGVVGFLVFARPALDRLAGRPHDRAAPLTFPLAEPYDHRGDRPTYHPAVLRTGSGGPSAVVPLTWAGSADLRTVASADGFAVFDAGDRTYRSGEIVQFLPLG